MFLTGTGYSPHAAHLPLLIQLCPPHEMADLPRSFPFIWGPGKPKAGPNTGKEASFLVIYAINC